MACLTELFRSRACQIARLPEAVRLFLGGGVLENHSLFGDLLRGELEGVGLQRQPTTVQGGAARGGAVLARALHLREEPMCSWVEARGTS